MILSNTPINQSLSEASVYLIKEVPLGEKQC
jgi:hypothetical protein